MYRQILVRRFNSHSFLHSFFTVTNQTIKINPNILIVDIKVGGIQCLINIFLHNFTVVDFKYVLIVNLTSWICSFIGPI